MLKQTWQDINLLGDQHYFQTFNRQEKYQLNNSYAPINF